MLSEWSTRRHQKIVSSALISQSESPPPPKRRRIDRLQAGQESSIIRPRKQEQSRTDNNSPTSLSRADATSSSYDRPRFSTPQSHAPSFEFNPSLSLPGSPAASNLLQLPGGARTEVSGRFVDKVLLNLAQTHQTIDQSDDEDIEDAVEGDTVEASNSVDHETNDLWNEEGVNMEGDVDPREGIVSDWDLLAEEFIVEAEELGKFGHSLLHSP